MSTLFSEAIKLKDGVLHNLEYHRLRVSRTLRQFGGGTVDLAMLERMIPADANRGLFKCRVVYGDRIEGVEFTPYDFRSVKKVRLVEDNDMEYGYKYADRSRLDGLLAGSACDDIIIVKNGLVTDSFAANLVFRSPSGLYTPASCLLRGTKRQCLLDRGVIREKEIRVEDIRTYDRVFFINAMTDLEDDVSVPTDSILL